MTGVLVRLLGAVEVAGDEGWVRAGPAKRSCVLAALAVSPRTPVSLETLGDRVWGADAPSSAHSTLYGHVAHLRAVLKDCSGPVEIRKSGPDGYLLDVDPEQIDVHAVRSLARQARDYTRKGDGAQAVSVWRRACDLVRGEALAGIGGDWAAEIRSGLRREYVAMLTERFAAELDLGRHAEIVEELSEHVARHPLSEGLVGCLMTALYRCGRQAEAVDCFAGARSRLAERLGADPGDQLQDLHLRILNQDPGLTLSSSKSEPPAPEAAPAAPASPFAQLPAAPRLFAGRAAELAALDYELHAPGGARLWTVSGPGGMGKSWLALHWAHLRRDAFADGQLYVNLHGFDPASDPVPPEAALRGLLETLGVKPSVIPTSLDAMAGLYRSMIAGRRMLLLVDDARSSSQVVPLLPGDDACFTVVTGRPGLTALAASHGARSLRLNTLNETEAHDALARQLGSERISAEPEATSELLDTCAGLPLALGILAARAAVRPDLPLTALAESVRDDAARLDALDTGELSASLRAVLEGSLAALSPDAARLFVLLGLAPGTDADRYAIASLAGVPLDKVDALLRELETVNLVEQRTPHRYRMHDLTRLYAAERARADCDEDGRVEALRRIVDHYVHTAAAGRKLMQRGLIPRDFGDPAVGCTPHPLDDLDAAVRWFADEHANILAAQQAAVERLWDEWVWALAWGLSTFHLQRRQNDDGVLVWRRAADAGERRGDGSAQAVAHHSISQMLANGGDHDSAAKHAARALELAESSGDVLQLSGAHDALGKSFLRRGDYRQALRHSTMSLELARQSGNQTLVAQSLNSVGWHRAHLGEYDAARGYCEEALEKAREIPEDYLSALILDSLGYIAFHSGRHSDALVHYGQALEIFHRFGVRQQEPTVMAHMADAHDALGRRAEAARLRREAADLFETQGYAEAAARLRQTRVGAHPDRTPHD
ncbi:MAG: AfsR/SARP family transcriptional regulator [Stackebrandtia sp.]